MYVSIGFPLGDLPTQDEVDLGHLGNTHFLTNKFEDPEHKRSILIIFNYYFLLGSTLTWLPSKFLTDYL